jgi:hypothetical protein
MRLTVVVACVADRTPWLCGECVVGGKSLSGDARLDPSAGTPPRACEACHSLGQKLVVQSRKSCSTKESCF